MVSVSYIPKKRPKSSLVIGPLARLKEFTKQPENLTILPGVRQLHDGTQYVIGQYPSGKQVLMPYKPVGAPKADMLPEPGEPARPFRPFKFLPTYDDPATGEKLPVLHRPRRLHVIEWQEGPLLFPKPERYAGSHDHVQGIVDREFRALMRSPDCGKTWQCVAQGSVTTFVQYHIDEEDNK